MVVATESTIVLVPSEEDITEMDKLMSDGKRNFMCKQPQIALDCFVELCEKLSKFYGQESEKCTEAYLYYGKTLLEIARIENGVLGHAVKETPIFGTATDVETEPEDGEKEVNTEDEEDAPKVSMDEIKNQVVLAMHENVYNESTDDDHTEEEGDMEDEEFPAVETDEEGQKSDQKEVKDDPATAEKDKETVESTTDSKEDGMEVEEGIDTTEAAASDNETDDVTNMELAWEMLELTTVICRRQLKEKSTELKEKEAELETVKYTLAESKHCLAQISLEAERYEDAVNDFKECLSIYEEVLEDKHDRLIAEGHYNIALALSFNKQYSEAITEFEVTVTLLEARVEDLRRKVKESDSEDEGSLKLKQWQKEIDQLNDLILLDMKSKIEDALESKKVLEESMKIVRKAATEMFNSGNMKGSFDKGFDEKSEGQKEVVHDCSDKIRSVKRTSDDATANTEKKMKPAAENEAEMAEATEASPQ